MAGRQSEIKCEKSKTRNGLKGINNEQLKKTGDKYIRRDGFERR